MSQMMTLSFISMLSGGMIAQSALSEEIHLKRGAIVTIAQVYWIDANRPCPSKLKTVLKVEAFSGGQYVDLDVVRGKEVTTIQCGNKVPGAWIVAKAAKDAPENSFVVKFTVKYDTTDGINYSSHSRDIKIVP